MENYQQLLDNIDLIVKKYEEIDRINGSQFNIFSILNIESDELKHSLFIAELLNPSGRHGFGSLFLEIFLKTVSITDFDLDNVIVHTEKSIGNTTDKEGGRIDIFLKDKNNTTIVIENKIYASDQPQQLLRYHNYAKHNVLYLNLNGDQPSEDSIKNKEVLLKENEHFRIISYRTHIIEWLELCRKEAVQFPLLREGLLHYINIIKYLLGQSTNENMKDEIQKLAFQNQKNLEMMATIANNFKDIQNEFHIRFWNALSLALKSNGIVIEETHKNSITTIASLQKNNGLWILIDNNNGYPIYYVISFDKCVYCGITIESDGKFIGTDHSFYSEKSKILLESNLGFKKSNYWLGEKEITPKLDFLDFKIENKEIFNLVEKDDQNVSGLDKTVLRIAEIALNDIKTFKSNINENELIMK